MWSKIPEKFSISGKEKEKPSSSYCHSSLYTVIHNIFLFFIIVAVHLRAFVGGGGRFVGEFGVFVGGGGGGRSTGFGQNRVLRDWNLFILQGFEGAKCRICWIFGTSQETGTGADGLFRVGLSGGAFGWGFRVGLSGGTRGLRQNSHIVFTTHKGHFSVRFMSRGQRQQAQVVFAAGKQGGGTFTGARTTSAAKLSSRRENGDFR